MAKQSGIIHLNGTLGGINFYTRKGKALARVAGGGFSGHAIKTKPSMVRVRENASEFGHCSIVKKKFKTSLNPYLCVRKDGTLHGRMMRLFMKLKGLDSIHERGQRRVDPGTKTEEGKQLLLGFDFTPDCDVLARLGSNGVYDPDQRTFRVTDFDTNRVDFPEGATHLALSLGLLRFDFDTLAYALKRSAPLYIDRNFTASTFKLTVDDPVLTGFELAVLGMKFYQEVDGRFYIFKSAQTVGVLVLNA